MADDDPTTRCRNVLAATGPGGSSGFLLAGQLRLVLLVTYALSATITAAWAVSLVRRPRHAAARKVTNGLLVVSAAVAILNLFISRDVAGRGHGRGQRAGVPGRAGHQRPSPGAAAAVDTQTVLGAIAAYLMVGMSFAFVDQAWAPCRPARSSGR